MAVVIFSRTVTNEAGVVTEVTQQVALPVDLTATDGTREILDLVLDPLDLDFHCGQVSHDRVVLNITAQQGPGNLLGNLLGNCSAPWPVCWTDRPA